MGLINSLEEAVWEERRRNPTPSVKCDGCFVDSKALQSRRRRRMMTMNLQTKTLKMFSRGAVIVTIRYARAVPN